jgi:hypothetical protein
MGDNTAASILRSANLFCRAFGRHRALTFVGEVGLPNPNEVPEPERVGRQKNQLNPLAHWRSHEFRYFLFM